MEIEEGTEPGASGRRQRNTDWTHDHHAELVAGLRAGATVEQLAEDLDRTPGAIRSRAKLLLPPGTPRARGEYAVDVLRELLIDDSGYDWESELAHSLDRLGRRYWNAHDTQRLRDAWETSTPLMTIAAEFGVDEPQLIRQLLSLGLAKNRAEIVDRLGCEPGGIVDLWQRMAADRSAAEVWILTIHGMPGEPAHVSLYSSQTAAEVARDQLLIPVSSADSVAATAWWCIAGRSPSFAGGETLTGEVTVGTGETRD